MQKEKIEDENINPNCAFHGESKTKSVQSVSLLNQMQEISYKTSSKYIYTCTKLDLGGKHVAVSDKFDLHYKNKKQTFGFCLV